MKITLDIHEYSVLIEAAWGAGTGLRTGIMQDAVDRWFHLLHPPEVAHLHSFFSERMKRYPVAEREQTHFLARHDLDNQYVVTAGPRHHHCYKVGEHYHVGVTWRMDPKQITRVVKLTEANWILEVNIARDLDVRGQAPPACPQCGEQQQIQIMNSLARPAQWRCRKCKNRYEQGQ